MADVKWIKLSTDLFNNRKIRMIESMPEGDAIVCIWMKILVLAGNVNDNGVIYFTPDIPYTDHMLATEFNRPLSTVQLALTTFQKFGMIEIVDDVIRVTNWERYQNIDGMEKIREQNRLRKQNQREREKQKLLDESRDSHVTVTESHATDKEEDIEEDIDIYNTAAVANNIPYVDKEIADKPQEEPAATVIAPEPNPPKRMLYPPTLDMVKQYAEKKGLTAVNCIRFHNFWTDKGWLKKGQKFDWRITLAEWNEDDIKKQKQQQKALRDEYIQRDSAYEPVHFDERMAAQIDSLKDALTNDFPDLEAEDQFIDYLDPDMDMTG